MLFGSLTRMSFLYLAFISDFAAIPCDFQFVELDTPNSGNFSEKTGTIGLGVSLRSLPIESFDCDEPRKDFEDKRVVRSSDDQYIFAKSDDSDYEDIESTCQISRKTIQPKALNNVYNKLTQVINTATFMQSITIEQCLSKQEPCYSGAEPPSGKKHICRQKYVKITLKALGHGNVITDEQFYYPSHCVCELVRVKKRSFKKCFRVFRNKN